jgi:arylsulfatase A-like enzyme
VQDNQSVEPPRPPEDGYHLTEDLVDRAIGYVRDQQHATPEKPFFLYFATGAMHAPHQAPDEWIEPYRGRFDAGWETWREHLFARQLELGVIPPETELTERPPWVASWEALPPDERRLFARQMEVFAGFLSHTDHQIGRLVEFLRETELLDDTLVLLISDNGTSAEGGPVGSLNEHRFVHDITDDVSDSLARIDDFGGFRGYNHYAWGWAWAGNTPLRLWKRYTWLGGVRTPLIAHWPARIAARGEVRDQFCHAVDLMPTILDAAGVPVPDVVDGHTQQPIDGASLLPTFADSDAAAPRSTQYFEMLGSRAIYHDGWKATTDHVGKQLTVEREALGGSRGFEDDRWCLFDLGSDFAEARDLADEHPERVRELMDVWWAEAGRNQVLPLDDSFIGRVVALEPSPHPPRFRTVYRPGGGPIAEDAMPPLGGGFRVLADVEIPDRDAEGILCALGDWNSGWALYLLDGALVVTFNLFSAVHRIATPAPVSAGRHVVGAEYRRRPPAGGPVTLLVDGEVVHDGTLAADLPFRWQIGAAGMLLGRDRGFPVCDDYASPFPFTGTLREVVFEIPALAPRGALGEIAEAMHRE